MAVGTILFIVVTHEERLVLFGVDFFPGMTAHTERINLCPRIHYVRRCTVSTRGPGFISDMFVGFPVTMRAAHIHPCMSDGDILIHVVDVADEAAAVVGH